MLRNLCGEQSLRYYILNLIPGIAPGLARARFAPGAKREACQPEGWKHKLEALPKSVLRDQLCQVTVGLAR